MTQNDLHPTELIVFQTTPFCNIDCKYCYLPNRSDARRMDLETIRRTCVGLRDARLLASKVAILWHAGEPLAVPVEYYEEAHQIIKTSLGSTLVDFSFQTNGLLLNSKWLSFFKRWNVQVGLSCDGPANFHDLNRRTRSNRGTAARVLAAAHALKRESIPLKIICVLTPESIGHPDVMFEFFQSLGADRVGFNIVEVNGSHVKQVFDPSTAYQSFYSFWVRYFDLALASDCRHRVRELTSALGFIFVDDHSTFSYERDPLRILTVGVDGGVSTFSPELLATRPTSEFETFVFANVHDDSWVCDLASSVSMAAVAKSIKRGIEVCRSSCEHFQICQGGTPATKLGELGTFAGAETVACQFKIKAAADSVAHIVSSAIRDVSAPQHS